MKTIPFIISILFFACSSVFGQEMAYKSESKENSAIQWESQVYDFGKLKMGSPAVTYFTFTNNSDEAILIEKVKTSCGCTASEYPKEPILPGAEASIKVTYDTKRTGAFSKTVSVYLNNSIPVTVLKIHGSVL